MRLTGLIFTCLDCNKEFEVFSDDGGFDQTVCWNYCPHCKHKVNIWVRFKNPDEKIITGLSFEEANNLK